jgi:sporulation integral membrane protein YlbJ
VFISFVWIGVAALFCACALLFPADTVDAARSGLALWGQNVLPALLPFVFGINMLTKLGFVGFIGVALQPVMQPLFRISGSGAFALLTGFFSGCPMGAKTVSTLRNQNLLTKNEAERLVGFTNNSGPGFIVTVVGVGMFLSVPFGYFLLVVHILSALVIGFVLRFFAENDSSSTKDDTNILQRMVLEKRLSRQKGHENIGIVLSYSIKNAVETLLYIGGFIVIFFVLSRFLELTVLNNFGIMQTSVIKGIFEMTGGVSSVSALPINRSVAVATAGIISFGGLSIHAQSIGFLSETDISAKIYMLSKLSHGIIASALAWVTYPFAVFSFQIDKITETAQSEPTFYVMGDFVSAMSSSVGWFANIFMILITLIILHRVFKYIYRFIFLSR